MKSKNYIEGEGFLLIREKEASNTNKFNYTYPYPNPFWNVLKRFAYGLFLAAVIAFAKFSCSGKGGVHTQGYTHTGISNAGITIPNTTTQRVPNAEKIHHLDLPTIGVDPKVISEVQEMVGKRGKELAAILENANKSKENLDRLSMLHNMRLGNIMELENSAKQQLDMMPADATHADDAISAPLPIIEAETETDLIE